jgi:hypothetical protein
MPKAYFEPENLRALADVLQQAKRQLSAQDINDPEKLDFIAQRILRLASDGKPPWKILREICPEIDPLPTAKRKTNETRKRHRLKITDRGLHLDKQVDPARRMAASYGAPGLAEIWEEHARLCEINAIASRQRKKRSRKRSGA